MTYEIMFNGVENSKYMMKFCDRESKIELNVDSWSFETFLSALMIEVPNDFRNIVYVYLVNCATKYFETHPISEEEQERFFELLDEISEHDYEVDE